MRSFGLMTLAFASAQEVDETAYLLQTRTLQQKSGEVEDCFVSGGCVTTTTTEAPTTTTTEAPTTPRPTRPTRPATTTTEATTTTTTEAAEPPPIGRTITDLGIPPSHNKFCNPTNPQHVLALNKPTINNLGGMPGKNNLGAMSPEDGLKQLRYDKVTKTDDGVDVHLIVTTGDTYKTENTDFKADYEAERKAERISRDRDWLTKKNGPDFVKTYNGLYKDAAMSIGSLAKGSYTFTFSFFDANDEPFVIPFLPMTFFDLDGDVDNAGGKSYEVVTTMDSQGIESVVGSLTKDSCDDTTNVCTVNSAKEEITIPSDFNHLSDHTKKAAVTFLFEGKSTFDITYTLNHEHRVFLFKGQCIDEDDIEKPRPTVKPRPTEKPRPTMKPRPGSFKDRRTRR